jgi:hypothetical protein
MSTPLPKNRPGIPFYHLIHPFWETGEEPLWPATHTVTSYGMNFKEKFYLNVLCGRHLVERYLISQTIQHDTQMLDRITAVIKSESARLNRCLKRDEITVIAGMKF